MYKIGTTPFARTPKPLDMTHYDLSDEGTKGGIVIYCVDGRFYKPDNSLLDAFAKALMEKLGWKFYDLVVWAGGIRVLASDDPKDADSKRAFVDNLKLSIKLHCKKNGVRNVKIAMVNHDDCGGYGYRGAFGNDMDAQAARYCADFEAAERSFRKEVSEEVSEFMPFVAMGDGAIYPAVSA